MEEIKVFWSNEEQRSLAVIDNKNIGECEIQESGDTWVITHTGVREEYGGRGIAKQLVLAVIDAARKNNKKILPLCSYAKHMMEGKEEYQDILVKQ